jgi:nitrate/TMAO reductase-like tetraheme cytochrome c subunit
MKISDRLRKYSPWLLLGVGLGVGAVAVVAFEQTMHYTSQDAFCMTCHQDNAGKEWMQSVHYRNPQGVVVNCASCHIPHDFAPKMVVKVGAIKDVWGFLQGKISTPEKYEALRLEMAQHEWSRLKANGAKECRQCHKLEAMDNPDMPFVKDEHEAALKSGKICTDCHQGVAHTPPGKAEVAQHP